MPFEPKIKLTGHHSAVYSIIDSAGDYFYSLGGDGFVTQWSKLNLANHGRLIAKTEKPIYCGFLSKSSNLLFLGCMGGDIHILDLTTNKLISSSNINTNSIFSITAYNDYIISGSAEGSLTFWKNNRVEFIQNLSSQSLRSLLIDHDNHLLIIACSDHHIYLFDLSMMTLVRRLKCHTSSIFGLHLTNSYLFTGGRDAKLSIWDRFTFLPIAMIDAHLSTINCICEHQEMIVTASRDKTIRLWLPNGQLVQTLNAINGGHINSVNCVASLLGTDFLVSGSDDRSLIIWSNE